MADYDFQRIETRWQREWSSRRVFEATEETEREKFMCVEMLPYPSGRIHTGHVRNYAIGDAVAHFQRLQNRNVLHPIGWDALGLPAENAAIERGADPREWTLSNIREMARQLRRMGFSYAWERETSSCSPEYYRWNQWFFLRMLEKDLAYRSRRVLNWCPRCNTVLANEQVEGGKCWRHDETDVEQREMDQWFVRITRYARELDSGLDGLTGWPDSVRTMQRNWIGRSDGARVRFGIEGSGETIEVFTTRIDTIFGATFLVLAPDHPQLDAVIAGCGREEEVRGFVASARAEGLRDRFGAEGDKRGVDTGRRAVNPFNDERIPVWVANFVLMEYGTGAIMSVPAHDGRDNEFAKKYGLPIRQVIVPAGGEHGDDELFTEETRARLVASGPYSGLAAPEARRKMTADAARGGFGEEAVSYRLRDWGISRQRYWGTPIPVIHCDGCGIVPVPEEDLPVLLPDRIDLRGISGAPLAHVKEFVEVACPACGGPGRRETDTMDTFVDSAWYFYRYLDPRNGERPFDPGKARHWFPIDLYIGGIEHATGHLIYCRFFHKLMRDLGLVTGDEPVRNLLTQGMVVSHSYFCREHRYITPSDVRTKQEDPDTYLCPHDGSELVRVLEKMSKSKNNSPDVDRMIERYGADTVRLYVLFAAPPESEFLWSEQGIEGCSRFLSRTWRLFDRHREQVSGAAAPDGSETAEALDLRRKLHRTIVRVTDDVGRRMHFNTAIAAIMELVNEAYKLFDRQALAVGEAAALKETFVAMSRMLVPFAPHMAEELHEGLSLPGLAVTSAWPVADDALLADEMIEIVVQVGGKMRGRVTVPRGSEEDTALTAAREHDRVKAAIGARSVARVVYVPDRLLNIVLG